MESSSINTLPTSRSAKKNLAARFRKRALETAKLHAEGLKSPDLPEIFLSPKHLNAKNLFGDVSGVQARTRQALS